MKGQLLMGTAVLRGWTLKVCESSFGWPVVTNLFTAFDFALYW